MAAKKSFLYRNGLSLVLLGFMLVSLFGQYVEGWKVHNHEQMEAGGTTVSFLSYITTGHFIQATFENWESEFFQMAMFVLLTIKLRQQGSAESKGLEGKEEVDRKPKPHPKAPWPVKKGGIWLKLYSNSLSIAFGLLFVLSFYFHLYGSRMDYNEAELLKGGTVLSMGEYIGTSRFWFESFQNWQSEFLSVLAIVWLSIWLRQKGSPESKPVDAPHDENE